MNGRDSLVDPGASRLVLRWVAFYTRGLPSAIAGPRADEIASDLFEQATAAAASGVSPRVAGRSMLARSVKGAGADLMWREQHLRRSEAARMVAAGSVVRGRYARLTAAVLAVEAVVLLVAILASIRMLASAQFVYVPPVASMLLLAVVAAGVLGLAFTVRPSTRVAGTIVFAALSIPMSIAAQYVSEAVSASFTMWLNAALQPLFAISYLFAFVVLLSPGVILAVFFAISASRLGSHRHHARLAVADSSR